MEPLTQDSRAPIAGRQCVAAVETVRRKGGDARVYLIAPEEGRDVRAEGGAELEPVAAGARVDEDARRDLSDNRHPVRAHDVQARPASSRHGILQARDALGGKPGQRVRLLRVDAAD